MNAIVAVSVIHRRGFTALWSPKSGNLTPSISLFSSHFHNDRSKARKIDFSWVKNSDDAIQLFHQMLRMRPQPSVFAYSKLLSIAVKMKHYSTALHMFDEMRKMGSPVDNYIMNFAINCCCLEKLLNFGFAIMGIIFKSGYEPNSVTFSTLIKGHFYDDKVADAVKLFKKIVDFRLCKPNDVIILTVIDGLSKSGQIIAAHDLLRRLERTLWKPNVKAYSALLDGLCKGGMVDDAFRLLSTMIHKGMSPNVVTYNSMIQGLCDVGRVKDVKDLINEMTKSNISPDEFTFDILINAYCKNGEMKDAEDMLEIMMQHNTCPSIVTYCTLIDGYCLRGKLVKLNKYWIQWRRIGGLSLILIAITV